MQGRIAKLLVDEGTQVKQGDLIAVLDPSELEAEARAAAAMIDSLRSQVSATQATSAATHGSTSSNVVNAQSRLEAARAQLLQAEAMLQRTESDSRRMIELAKQGVASDQDRVQAESNLKAQAGDGPVSERPGQRCRGGPEHRDREHSPGPCGCQHGAIDARTAGQRRGTTQGS